MKRKRNKIYEIIFFVVHDLINYISVPLKRLQHFYLRDILNECLKILKKSEYNHCIVNFPCPLGRFILRTSCIIMSSDATYKISLFFL